jgi:ABC-2 family transporter protein
MEYVLWFNKTFLHTVPVCVNSIHNALLLSLTNNTQGINTTILPFDHVLTAGEVQLEKSNPNNVAYFSLIMAAAFAMIMGGLIMPLAQERALSILFYFFYFLKIILIPLFYIHLMLTDIKRLMLVSGTSKLAYWISALTWDIFILFVISLVTLILLAIVNMTGFRGEEWGVALLMFLLYSFAGNSCTF